MSGSKRNYFENDVNTAVGRISETGEEHTRPRTNTRLYILKERLLISPPAEQVPVSRNKMPFNLTRKMRLNSSAT